MGTRVIPASEFQANCLELLASVTESGAEIPVTRNGRVVDRVVPSLGYIPPAERLLSADELLCTAHWVDDEDVVGPTGEPLPGEGRKKTPIAVPHLRDSILYEGDIVSWAWSPLTSDTGDYRI